MHVRGRAAMPALVAVLLAGFVAVAPASAATVGARWQARMGPGGANGTATATIDTSGAGTISVNLKRLARGAVAQHADAAGGRPRQARKDAKHRCFPGAIRAEEAEKRSFLHPQADVVQPSSGSCPAARCTAAPLPVRPAPPS